MQTNVKLSSCVQGDRKTFRFRVYRPNQDFTGVSVASKIRLSSAAASVYTFTPVVDFPDGVTNMFYITLTLPAATSATLALGTYVGDLTISISTTFGPYTPVRFTFDVTERIL
jgi:hypothetical protein